MIRQGLRFNFTRDPWKHFGLGLYVAKFDEQGALSLNATAFQFEPMPERHDPMAIAPVGYLHQDEAQNLANALWDAGIRPTQSQQGQGMFEAQGRHLNDMRAIVGSKLNITLKEKE